MNPNLQHSVSFPSEPPKNGFSQKYSGSGAPRRVVVLGGGISGLSAAYYLNKQAKEQGVPVEITLVERSERLGGKLRTERRGDFLIEKGPDSFLARKPAIMELTKELGLESELVPTNPDAKTSYILHKGRMHPMPMGFILGIPTKLTPFMRTGLISPLGKLRAALDFFLPARRGGEDEALGDFIERRLGREVLERITEPLLAGIYAGDTRRLSMLATFPQFKAMEERSGSLIKGMARGGGRPKSAPASAAAKRSAPSAAGGTGKAGGAVGKSMFLSYRGGLSALIERLEERLRREGVRIVTGAGADSLTGRPDGRTDIVLDSGERLNADGVICAVPAFEAARLLKQAETARRLQEIEYVSVANIALAYRTSDLNISFERSGFLVPRKEGKMITACTWSSTKWKHVAPQGRTLLRTYIGRAGAQEWTSMSDAELIEAAKRDLRELTGLDAEPQWAEVSRCMSSMPQYPVGQLDMLREARSELEEKLPGVLLCGAGYGGVGIPDCIAGGRDAAKNLLKQLPPLEAGENAAADVERISAS
ncbi:protoporphyrinogen oxidase [Saccharibacillus sp. CPCC 101409]|uniref:protoporphyrinogen oxidase n=1 Tax=Saccharibacillus sp. CPCC 101409 TaxID=3058041 RepID=UPI002673003E|nr:protoporphyrinogen oxidase [Saccharibacillus sp. CPCC 101409]MDO3412334.1 protoporphyrinogen oxidase [Saccharibacillus sp. CPCC 101409]